MAYGFRLSSEFAGSVLGGSALGWCLDRVLPTSPWGIILFTLIGFIVRLLSLIKATKRRV